MLGPNSSQGPQDPQTLDALSQLIMRLPRASSPLGNPALQPQPPAQPPASPAQPAGQPAQPAAAGTADLESRIRPGIGPRAQDAPPAPPSDDPAITQAQAGLTAAQGRMSDLQSRYGATQAKISAVPTVDPRQYKPKWYDRLLGAGVGFAEGYGRGNESRGAEAGGNATYRSLNAAQQARQRTLEPLMQQLNSEREELPMVSAAQQSAYQQYEGARDTSKLGIQSQAAMDKAEFNNKIADIKEQIGKNNYDAATKRIDELEKAAHDRTESYRDRTQMLGEIQQLKSDTAAAKSGKGTAAQSLGVQNRRDAAWGKARREYDAASKTIDPKDAQGQKQAQEDYYEKLQDAQDEYEQGVGVLGGTAEHVNLERNHFGEQPSTPSAPSTPGGIQKAPKPGTQLTDKSIAQGYLKAAGGDKNKARELAKGDGWKF